MHLLLPSEQKQLTAVAASISGEDAGVAFNPAGAADDLVPKN